MSDHTDQPRTPAPAPTPAPTPAPAPGVGETLELAATSDPHAAPAPAFPAPGPAAAPPDPQARRARRRAALRWGSATLVFALAGTGTALALTAPERTDIPGLATAGDGRYTFPALALPPLPAGKKAPDAKNNVPHWADLRYLVLPAPREAGAPATAQPFPTPTATPTPTPTDTPAPTTTTPATPTAAPTTPAATAFADWTPCDAIGADQQDATKLRPMLQRNVCLSAVVREWTTSDGTRTQIRLLRFASPHESWDAYTTVRARSAPKALPDSDTISLKDWDSTDGVALTALNGRKKTAKDLPTARLAYLSASDVMGVVTMTNPDGVPLASFRQVVTLQADLLG
ncbi:hypothetical protein ACIBCA_20445 [Kitasatospora sp. NPDC051170]|uniref:hypothetical protein n=1 Tax=Kitasatospora sp. NPDC051170 TaxID=3364056 RepID=UPI0037B8C25C